jgi:hypothetical protein
LDDGIYTPISDIMLPAKNGTTQIDHVVVSRYGVFVIETKDYGGWIFGGEDQAKWTQVFYSRKSQFQNPLRQNYRHTKTLSELTHIPHHYFKSVVVFAGDATFKTEMPDNVVYVGDLARHIEGFEKYVIRDEQVPDVASAIREWAGTVSPEDERLHVEMLRKRMRPPAEGESPDCPKCGNPMTMRTNRSDNSRFWGCSGYPRCRGTRSVA